VYETADPSSKFIKLNFRDDYASFEMSSLRLLKRSVMDMGIFIIVFESQSRLVTAHCIKCYLIPIVV
jgi:hypothetical protein